jgi:hypothetical protein
LASQRASSVNKFILRLAPEIEVQPHIGCGRVNKKFQMSHARTVVFPGPLQLLRAIRGECGKASSTSSCQASGVTPNNSRTMSAGCSRHAAIFSAADELILIGKLISRAAL